MSFWWSSKFAFEDFIFIVFCCEAETLCKPKSCYHNCNKRKVETNQWEELTWSQLCTEPRADRLQQTRSARQILHNRAFCFIFPRKTPIFISNRNSWHLITWKEVNKKKNNNTCLADVISVAQWTWQISAKPMVRGLILSGGNKLCLCTLRLSRPYTPYLTTSMRVHSEINKYKQKRCGSAFESLKKRAL